MRSWFWKNVKCWLAGGVVAAMLGTAGGVRADDKDVIADLQRRLEALEKQNEKLNKLIEIDTPQPSAGAAISPAALEKAVDDALKKKEEAVKAANPDTFKVGGVLDGKVRWAEDVNGFKFETTNKDFTAHLGGRLQMDTVWWSQDPQLAPQTQVGDLQDGQFFRRVRIQFEGTAWEVVEWNFEYALENAQQSIVGLDEFWVGVTKIPVIGTVRIGHQKVPQGLEGDCITSSKAMQFLERAAYTDAFYNNFAAGIWFGNNFLDQRTTYSAMFYRTEQSINAADFGDGEYAATGRVTALPIYENDGRCLIHVGLSGTWREAEKLGNHLVGPRFVRFQARPEMRDAAGDFNEATPAFPGPLPGDAARLVDTGNINANSLTVIGTEFLAISGPFSLQAEWAFTNVQDAVIGKNTDTLGFNGGYVSASYFLTGENRLYDRRLGRLNSTYVRPYTNFWAVRDENGINLGRGAWEVVARYSYLNLNDGAIRGGVEQGMTFGLNWYLTPSLKVQFDYLKDARWHRNGASPPGNNSGEVDGFGIRTQFYF